MIINTGLRTDIPAFYWPWFKNRIEEGFVLVRNPFFPQVITEYRLDPEVVDLIVFCTKNPLRVIDDLDFLSPFRQLWFVSITGYGRDIEPHVPDKHQVIEGFKRLSEKVGAKNMIWRFDPILLADRYTEEYQLRAFSAIAESLRGYTDTIVISFVDLYAKVKRNFPELKEVSHEATLRLSEQMVKIAAGCGMRVKSCAEGDHLAAVGVDTSGCMTREVFERAIGQPLKKLPKIRNRSNCDCLLIGDIGSYDSCPHLCRYCYANADREKMLANFRDHDPASPLLIGHLKPDDIVKQSKQVSWLL